MSKDDNKCKVIDIELRVCKGVDIDIDSRDYKGFTFKNCLIKYGGGDVSVSDCTFNNCQWTFVAKAGNTLKFMSLMYRELGDHGRNVMEKTFENIKNSEAEIWHE